MSVKIYYYCDRCGTDIRGDESINLVIDELSDGEPNELLFCTRCFKSLRQWMSKVNPG